MDAQTITKLAKAHATLISQYSGLSQAESFSLVGQIMQFIAGGGVPSSAEQNVQPANASNPRDAGASNSSGSGPVLARPGQTCYCSSCKSELYEIIAEIRGQGMGVNAFCQAFRPLGHSRVLTREDLEVIKDPDGNTFIDCPVCKGQKTLMLLGTRRQGQVNQSAGVTPVVSSVGAGEVGM